LLFGGAYLKMRVKQLGKLLNISENEQGKKGKKFGTGKHKKAPRRKSMGQ